MTAVSPTRPSPSDHPERERPPEVTPGVDLDSMSERELERLHSGLVRLASLDDIVLAALVEQVLAGDELASSS